MTTYPFGMCWRMLLACGALVAVSAASRGQTSAPASSGVVEAWGTTPDKAKLLAKAPTVRFTSGEQLGVTTRIDVDTAISYQVMVGFGASITDASAGLISTKLPPR